MAQLWYETGENHAVSVSGSAVELTTQLDHADRSGVVIQNLGTEALYIGFDSNVTASNGLELAADDEISFDGPVAIFGISAGSSDVRVLELQ